MFLVRRSHHHAKGLLVVVLSAGLVLSGCAGSSALRSKYAVAGDVCEAKREPIYTLQDEFAEKVWQTALIGGLFGAGLGLILGGDVEGAILGGIVGAASGAAAGYLRAKASQVETREDLVASIDSDINADSERLQGLNVALRNLNDCRESQLDALKADIEGGRIDKADAGIRLEEIRTAMSNDNAIINEVLGEADERQVIYVEAQATAQEVEQEAVLGDEVKDYEPRFTDVSLQAEPAMVARTNSNVRVQPTTDAEIIGLLKAGESAEMAKAVEGSNWYRLSFNGRQGFVHGSLLEKADLGAPFSNDSLPQERPKVIDFEPSPQATPIDNYVLLKSDVEAQQAADQQYLEGKADTIDVLLQV